MNALHCIQKWKYNIVHTKLGISLVVQVVKNPSANAGDMGVIPWSGRAPGEGNGNQL